MDIDKILQKEKSLSSIIWIWKADFYELLPVFTQCLDEYYANLNKNRKRKQWGWRKWILKTPKDKLFYILFYMKVYPTFEVAASIFGTVKSKTYEWTVRFLPLLEKALGRKAVLPTKKADDLEKLVEENPNLGGLFIDWTERPINRPKKDKQQRRNYSWKKKQHTIKNTVVSTKDKEVIFVWDTQEWKIHDKKLAEKDGLDNLEAEKYWDSGYAWLNGTIIPKKKTKNKPLTEDEKLDNRALNSIRAIVENAIAGIKRLWIVSQKYRNRIYWNFLTVRQNFKDKVIRISAWLHNLMLKRI